MNEFHKLPSLEDLERSNNWGFGDIFELLCNHTHILPKALMKEELSLNLFIRL